MKLLIVLLAVIGGSIKASRSASAADCEVSLPQHSSPECMAIRNAALAQNKKTFTLKQASHGFALLNMTIPELGAVALNDPFSSYYTRAYVGLVQINSAVLEQYNSTTFGQEITDISEYLKMSQFFQSALEPAVGEYARRISSREAFNDDKTTWIEDRFFTQQRLAGNNPLSIKRVTIHGEEERRCTVKTTKGKWCHFPFRYRGKVYYKCTTAGYNKPWCSTTEVYRKRRGVCQAQESNVAEGQETEDCTVKTTNGEWCYFPFYYKRVKYEECTTKDHSRPWCATVKRLKNKDRRWGNCAQGKVEKKGPVGLDWSKLKETLNPEFDWETAVQTTLKTDDSLDDVIKQGRINALRYELCDDLPRSPDLTDRDPRRTMRDFLSPIALFASAKVGEQNELVPVAIQMDYKPNSTVYTPGDGDNWLIAKLNVQITDIGYAQITEHLARVHYFVEPFCVSLKRTLPAMHPLNQILKYHCRETIVPTTFGTPILLGDKGFADVLFAYGKDGAFRLLRDIHPLTSWEVTDFRKNIEDRGLDDINLLPYFPFRDDGFKILKVIEAMVEDYVNLSTCRISRLVWNLHRHDRVIDLRHHRSLSACVDDVIKNLPRVLGKNMIIGFMGTRDIALLLRYYKEDKDVREDVELQAYLNEVSLDGTGQNGGIGRIRGFPASIDSKEELCEILSRFISHVTIYHASVNYVVTDYPEYVPNQPTKLYDDTRVQDGEFSVFRLPNRLTSAIQSSAFLSLGEFRFDSLFDYGNELQDVDAVNLVNGYYNYLMTVVQPHMQEENEKRKKTGHLTYPYFIPRWLPNGVQT